MNSFPTPWNTSFTSCLWHGSQIWILMVSILGIMNVGMILQNCGQICENDLRLGIFVCLRGMLSLCFFFFKEDQIRFHQDSPDGIPLHHLKDELWPPLVTSIPLQQLQTETVAIRLLEQNMKNVNFPPPPPKKLSHNQKSLSALSLFPVLGTYSSNHPASPS